MADDDDRSPRSVADSDGDRPEPLPSSNDGSTTDAVPSSDDGRSDDTQPNAAQSNETRPDETRSNDTRPDGGTAGFDEDRLYRVVNEAVKDALLYVIGTVLLVVTALVFFLFGLAIAIDAQSSVVFITGGVIALVAGFVGLSALDVLPPIREWGDD